MFHTIRQIPTVEKLKEKIPISKGTAKNRDDAIKQICAVLDGSDKRKLVIVGPCSADDPNAVCDYATRLAGLAQKVRDKMYVVMRVYTAKPRTRGDGYSGLIHIPNIASGAIDISNGVEAMRKLHARVVNESGLFTADELLYPDAARYVDDLVCYYSVGARTCDSPLHRFVASGLNAPVGIKNPMNGNLADLVASVGSARSSNEFLYGGSHVKTSGNAFSHAVLRGAVDSCGNHISNYDYDSVARLREIDKNVGRIIIDVGHSNSGKSAVRQCDVLKNVLQLVKAHVDYDAAVAGFMIESYIAGGCGAPNSVYGRSVTDECLSFADTERLLLDIAGMLP